MKKLFFKALTLLLLVTSVLINSCTKNETESDDIFPSASPGSDNVSRTTRFKIIVLMYHNVVQGTPADIYQRNSTDFDNDLNYIKAQGYQLLSFDDLLLIKAGTKLLTKKGVIISFDDGYLNNYTIAYSKLKAMKFPATFFVISDLINQSGRMTTANLQEMDQYRTFTGNKLFSIEDHSKTHPFLQAAASNYSNPADYQSFLNAEIGDSKNVITGITGQTSMWLALPNGDGASDPTIINTAKAYGYSGIRTSIWGAFNKNNMDPFVLPSLPILSTTPITNIETYLN
jgi:peptidoglycan/xylan/chitin deacetylase (PgdA/CDA1 family)